MIGFGWRNAHGLLDMLGLPINPATEDKQDAIITALGGDYDHVDVTYPNDETEVYTFSANAITLRTITLIYTDSGKTDLLSVDKT